MNAERRRRRLRLWLAVFFFFGTASGARAEWGAGVEKPRWFRLRLDEAYTKVNVEGQRETYTGQGGTSRQEYLTVEPTLGVGLNGSVYHPNLLGFDLAAEAGPSWQESTQDPPGGTSVGTQLLQRYHSAVNLLRVKPYATRSFADKDVTFSDFDFFNRVRVDSQRYGGDTGYGAGPAPFRLGYVHLKEDVTGLRSGNSANDQNTLTFSAHNERGKTGRTEFTYLRDQYVREQEGTPTVSGVNHSANLFDTETWGKGDWIRLRSMALYNSQSGNTIDTRSLTLQENLDLSHAPNLSSSYRYSCSPSRSGSVDSDAREAGAQVQHRLYESLTSTFDVHGSTQDSSSADSTFRERRYGAGWNESYTKRIPTRGRLALGFNIGFDRTRRESTGQFLTIVNEPHRLADGTPTYLNQPGVSTVNSVTDPAGIPYAETLDYEVVPQGVLTEIRRVPGGRIPNGGSVLVTYTAAAPPSDAYTTLSRAAQVRLELFDRVVALYGRLNRISNYGGDSLILQELTDMVVGAEFTWRWLRAGAEYEDYRSNLSPYSTVRFFQSFAFEPTESSTLSLDFAQSRTTFPDSDLARRSFSSIGRFRARIASPLLFSAEGGVRVERGQGVDQDLKTARAILDFVYGQMTASASYEFQQDDSQGELRVKHFYYLRVKRMF